MKNRTIETIAYGQPMDMGGFPIRQALPSSKADSIDPFLLLHHAVLKVDPNVDVKHAGVGPHPHRGFSPVTFIFKGGVHHRDSFGNSSVITAGGVQWMNAGRGIIHSERPPVNIHELGSRQEIIQLWVNTPAKFKMDTPQYHPASADEIPVYSDPKGLWTLHSLAGSFMGMKGPVPTLLDVNAATLNTRSGAEIQVEVPENHTVILYVLDGKVQVPGYGSAEGHHAILFKNDG